MLEPSACWVGRGAEWELQRWTRLVLPGCLLCLLGVAWVLLGGVDGWGETVAGNRGCGRSMAFPSLACFRIGPQEETSPGPASAISGHGTCQRMPSAAHAAHVANVANVANAAVSRAILHAGLLGVERWCLVLAFWNLRLQLPAQPFSVSSTPQALLRQLAGTSRPSGRLNCSGPLLPKPRGYRTRARQLQIFFAWPGLQMCDPWQAVQTWAGRKGVSGAGDGNGR